jgi:hypothetical protein
MVRWVDGKLFGQPLGCRKATDVKFVDDRELARSTVSIPDAASAVRVRCSTTAIRQRASPARSPRLHP